jgi:hypothetical protein
MSDDPYRAVLLGGVVLALLVLALETLWLARLSRQGAGRGLPWLTILLITGAGFGLILALLLALLSAPALWIAFALACAGLAHGWDLLRRLSGTDRDPIG